MRGSRARLHSSSQRTEQGISARLARFLIPSLALFAGGVALFELSAQQISATTADAATALLEGHSIASGDVLLHGWALSLDSFWALEALLYAVVERVTGVHLYLLHLIPAIIAAGVISLGFVLVTRDRARREQIVGVVLVLALLAFPSPVLAYFFFQGPWHIATALAVLIVLTIVTCSCRPWALAVATVILAFTLLSDTTTLFLGVLPLFGVGLCQLLRTRRFRTGVPYITISVLSVVVALVVHEVGHALGMFTLANRSLVISPRQLSHNAFLLVHRIPALFGVGNLPLHSVTQGAIGFEVVRSIFLLAVVAALMAGFRRFVHAIIRLRHVQAPLSTGRSIEGVLLLGVLGDLVFYIVGSANGHVEFTKYLTAGAIFLAIYSARALGELAGSLNHRASFRGGAVLMAGCAVICGYQFVNQATKPAPPQKTHQLTVFLEDHHLGNGMASYPIANLVSVDSSLRTLVRPVEADAAGLLVSFDRQRDSSWYLHADFRYLIYDTTVPWHGVDASSARKTFGTPTKIYVVGPYRVLEWKRALSVSVAGAPSGSPLQIIVR